MPFLSAKDLFCLRVATSAQCDGTDPFQVLRGVSVWFLALRLRRRTSGWRYKKARNMRGLMGWSGNDALVLAPGLSGLCRRLGERSGIGRRTDTGV